MFKIKRLSATAILPTKAKEGDAGFDVYSNEQDTLFGSNHRWYKFRLGFALELPPGWMALIQEKSGMAVNDGIMTIGNIIDSGYRGECHATLLCMVKDRQVRIKHGQKIAQMIIIPCYTDNKYDIVDELSVSERGDGGFGSTGLEPDNFKNQYLGNWESTCQTYKEDVRIIYEDNNPLRQAIGTLFDAEKLRSTPHYQEMINKSLPADGRHVSRRVFRKLFNIIGYEYGKYSWDRFALPNCTAKIISPCNHVYGEHDKTCIKCGQPWRGTGRIE